MTRFKIAEFDIDVHRCRISSPDFETVVEPKVMDVLCFLYAHSGSVISQQDIFNAVWPNTTFNPGSVQRCIALLRKALNEDAKQPRFVLTHPKRGYSLEVPIAKAPISGKKSLLALTMATCCVLLILFNLMPQSTIKTDFSTLLPVSFSGENETFASLSPDGQYLAFVRGEGTNRHIWLKQLASGEEIQLTSQATNYNVLAWSPDGSAIAFMYLEPQLQQRTMAYISLNRLTMSALKQTTIYQFEDTYVNGNQLQWHANNHIYFVEWDKARNDTWLAYIDMAHKSKHRLKQSQGQEWLITLALSPNQQQLALGYEVGQNRYNIVLFDIAKATSKTIATVENSIQGLSWHPNEASILVSNRNQLQLVNLAGDVSRIPFNNYQFIRDAQFMPDGEGILMELRSVDVDILRQFKASPEIKETLIDSASLDIVPVYSPDDQRLVFESHRTGLKQLYLYEQGQQRMIFPNPDNEELFGSVWSPDGKWVYAASKDKLFKINPENASFETLPHPHSPFGLREHFNHENALLVSYRAEDGTTFHPAKLDLSTMNLTTYTSSGERLACYSMTLDNRDKIYYANSTEIFRLQDNGSAESLWRTNDQEIHGLRVHDENISVLLASAEQFQLAKLNIANPESDNQGIDNQALEVIHQGQQGGDMLTNSSHDEAQFLYLSEPVRTSKLVKLQ